MSEQMTNRAGRWARSIAAVLLAAAIALPAAAADIMVSAAASLTNAFTDIGKAFEAKHSGARVLFNFGASGSLLQQIARGAPVDVFASADMETMDRAQKQNLVFRDSWVVFAANKLVLATNVAITDAAAPLSLLARDNVKHVALGNPTSVPVGRYAKAAMEKAGVWDALQPKLVLTQNVRQSLDYLSRGEVDAAFVYATDVAIAPLKPQGVAEVQTEKPILYPIAAVKGFGNERWAREFVAFVRSAEGVAILQRYGFLKP